MLDGYRQAPVSRLAAAQAARQHHGANAAPHCAVQEIVRRHAFPENLRGASHGAAPPHLDHGLEPDRQLGELAGLLLLGRLRAPEGLDGPVALVAQLLHAELQVCEPRLRLGSTRCQADG